MAQERMHQAHAALLQARDNLQRIIQLRRGETAPTSLDAPPTPTQDDIAQSAEDAPPQPGPSTQRPPARQRRKSEKARQMDGLYETDLVSENSGQRSADSHGAQDDGSTEDPGRKRRRDEEYNPGDGQDHGVQMGVALQDGMVIMLQECDKNTGEEKRDKAPLPCYFHQGATDRLHEALAGFFAGTQHVAYRQRVQEGTLFQSAFLGGKIGRFRKDGSLDVVYFVPCPHPGFFEQDLWVMFTTPATAKAYCEGWEAEKPRTFHLMKPVSHWEQPTTTYQATPTKQRKRQKTPEAAGGAPEAGPSAVAVDMAEQPPPPLPPASDTLQAWVAAAVEGGQPDAAAAAQTEAEAAQGDGTAPAGAMHETHVRVEARAAGRVAGAHIAHASGSSTGPATAVRPSKGTKARAPASARAAAVGEESNMPINAQAVLAALIRSQISTLAATATTQAAAATKAQVQPLQDGVAYTGPAAPPLAVTRRPSAGSGASAGPAPPAVITLIPGQAAKAARPRQGSQPGTVPGPSGTTHRPATIDGLANTAPAGSAGMVETTGASGLRAAVLEGLKQAGVLDESCREARANVATKEAELAAARQESAARDQQLSLHLIAVKQMAARLDPPQIVPTLAASETPSFSAALSSLETAELLCTALEAELKQRGQAVRMTEGGKAAAKAACMRAQQELFEADSNPATFGRAQQKVGEANAAYSEAVALWTAATEALNACQEQHAAAQAARDTALAPVLAFLRQLPTTM